MFTSSNNRILIFLVGVLFVPITTVLVIFFARGYRPNFTTGQIQPTGLLVTHSYPDGAQVYLNGELKTATNNTLNLPPAIYEVEIKKDGYQAWKKHMTIEPEIVTRATAVLFPTVPTLKAITTSGAATPTLSPDGSKVVFTRYISNQSQIYILDINESPLGLLNRDARLVTTLPIRIDNWQTTWSPDSRQILITPPLATPTLSSYLLSVFDQQSTSQIANPAVLLNTWKQSADEKETDRQLGLLPSLRQLIATTSAHLNWSPKENRFLYTATASATLPEDIKKPLPGSSTQPQERNLIPGGVYVYDIEEDRNFRIDTANLITPTPTPKKTAGKNISPSVISPLSFPNAGWSWFPTSSHLFRLDHQQIRIIEYDGQNSTVVYSGPMDDTVAIPYPSAKQMLILTSLNPTPATSSAILNLYALTLR